MTKRLDNPQGLHGRPMSSIPIDDEALEGVDGYRHLIRESFKRWDNRLTRKGLVWSEEYRCGNLGVIVCFDRHTRPKGRESRDSIGAVTKSAVLHRNSCGPIRVEEADFRDMSRSEQGQQDHMLVRVIQDMERVNGGTRAAVNLQVDEELLRILPRRFQSATGGFVIDLPRRAGRELCPAILCALVDPDQFPSGMVERRPEVVDSIPDNKSDVGRHLGAGFDSNSDPALRITVNCNSVGVVGNVAFKEQFELLDVLLSSLNFEA